jgi:hypothetical protein
VPAGIGAAAPDAPRQGPIHPSHSPTAAAVAVRTERNAGHSADTLRQEIVAAGHSADKLSRFSSFSVRQQLRDRFVTKRGRHLLCVRLEALKARRLATNALPNNIPRCARNFRDEIACQAVGQCITHTVSPQLNSTFVAGFWQSRGCPMIAHYIALGNPLAIVSAERIRLPQ